MCYSRPIAENDYSLRVCKGCYMHVRKTVGFLWQEGWTVQKAAEPQHGPLGLADGVQGSLDRM
ncbi:hypothetical protein LCGC14_2910830 [marine sediment metagenome]|uniref:Uncharacterized protein n=1 Tax=marine sediment metagenome TaxID=412755 RepID=A0A0F8YDH4_9ZZZZ